MEKINIDTINKEVKERLKKNQWAYNNYPRMEIISI